jgi:hypothetical protein
MIRRAILCLVAWALGTAGPAGAEPIKAATRLNHPRISLGQVAVVTVRVSHVAKLPEVKAPTVANCRITLVGQPQKIDANLPGQHMTEVMERLAQRIAESIPDDKKKGIELPTKLAPAREDYVFLFRVQPELVGEITLPPFQVTVGEDKTQTQPMKLAVAPSSTYSGVHVGWAISKLRPKVNEEVTLYIEVATERRPVAVQNREFAHLPLRNVLILFPKPDNLVGVKLTRPLDQVAADFAVPAGKVGFHIQSLPEPVLFRQDNPNDVSDPKWFRYRLPIPVRFTEKGPLDLATLSMIGEVYAPAPETTADAQKRAPATKGRWIPFETFSTLAQVEVLE